MTIEFTEAVRRSKKLIESGLEGKFRQHSSGEFQLRTMGGSMLRKDPARLLNWAAGDAEGFDALRFAVADALEQGEQLPAEIREWLLKYLRGETLRPKGVAGRKGEDWLHQLIYMAVLCRIDDGMTATRNDESPKTSACDAVAEAMSEIGREPATFHGVKRVWLDMEKRKGTSVPAT
jgi:hypothetical protein